jgi:hypothetical protein
MLSKEQIEQNKQTFLDLINSIQREGFEKDKLINWLEKSDFFTAPASTKYHCNFEGGLCYHSLNVYYSLESLCYTYANDQETILHEAKYDDSGNLIEKEWTEFVDHLRFETDSIIIIGLLHDISKANMYEKYLRNVKNNETGKWDQIEEYRVIDSKDRFIFGSHEETSEFMVRSFISLKVEESVAILHHMGGQGFDSSQTDLSVIYGKYNLACLLHAADLLSTFCLENKE